MGGSPGRFPALLSGSYHRPRMGGWVVKRKDKLGGVYYLSFTLKYPNKIKLWILIDS
jgi:hypothetical protein